MQMSFKSMSLPGLDSKGLFVFAFAAHVDDNAQVNAH
jgi:hypothetical protein